MRLLALAVPLLLAACGEGGARPEMAGPAPRVPVPGGAAQPAQPARPLPAGAVIGQSARGLIAQFGTPILDVTEGAGRKLQFGSTGCVLDAYLYARGRGEPVVTYAEARRRDGGDVDPGACAASLRRR